MTEITVKLMGDPTLTEESIPVTEFDETLHLLIKDLKETMIKKGGVGIAAPQIGINKRVILFGFDKNERYPTEAPVPFTVLINPEYKILSDKLIFGWEGCLSVPGLRGLVPRYESIQYQGYDMDGNLIERTAEGFHARIIQHEVDHLDGILFPFRIEDLRDFGYEEAISKSSKVKI